MEKLRALFSEILFVEFFVSAHDTRYVKVSHFAGVAAVTYSTVALDAKLGQC